MFADIVGSSALYDQLGDVVAQRIIAESLSVMARIVRHHDGRVAAELGDELMCYFPTAGDAAAAAGAMHARLSQPDPLPTHDFRHQLRIGLHVIPVGDEEAGLASEAGKVAHWVARQAKADQTLATLPVIDALPGIFRAVSWFVGDETWNFVSFEHVTLYEIVWDVGAITVSSRDQHGTEDDRYDAVIFVYEHQTVLLNAERPVLSVGRADENDLSIKHDLVSRQHFTAQFSRGRCTLTDKSTNGTVLITDGEMIYTLKRDVVRLTGGGQIVLGHTTHGRPVASIRFDCL